MDNPSMPEVLEGIVQSGKRDAARWLSRFEDAYRRKTGMKIFPGSLNLRLDREFDWDAPRHQPHILWFGREEYGGERDILLLPCVLRDLDGRRGFLWTTTIGAHSRPDRRVVEVITDADLRGTCRLADGDRVAVELPG